MLSRMRRGLHITAAVLAAALSTACHRPAAALKVGMVPDAGASQVSIEQKAPLKAYLEQRLHRPVSLVIPTNYNATVEGLGNGSLDVAYLGGLTFVKARQRYGVIPLVQRDADQKFHSLFITRAPGVNSLADLKGRSFCFGDINSTSGHLYPYLAMKQAGITPQMLKSFRYTGSHPATIQAVASGACDAGAVDETVYASMLKSGKLPPGLRVFFTSPPFADYVWVAAKDLDPAARKAVADAFLQLQPGRDDQALSILRARHYVRADGGGYADVERVARELGLM